MSFHVDLGEGTWFPDSRSVINLLVHNAHIGEKQPFWTSGNNGRFHKFASFVGVFAIRALLFGIYIRALFFGNCHILETI